MDANTYNEARNIANKVSDLDNKLLLLSSVKKRQYLFCINTNLNDEMLKAGQYLVLNEEEKLYIYDYLKNKYSKEINKLQQQFEQL
jgi:hypothetical protein